MLRYFFFFFCYVFPVEETTSGIGDLFYFLLTILQIHL